MIWSWLHRHPRTVDIALVGVLLFLGSGAAIRQENHAAAALTLGAAATLTLLARRHYPRAVVLVVGALTLAMVVRGVWAVPVPLGVALYTLMATRPRAVDRAVGVAAIVAVAIAVLGSSLEFGAGAARIVFLIAAALLGDSVGSRRAYVHEIEEKAERLERERESETRRAAAEEQARIARELHDVIAHALSVIVVQAGAADDAFEIDAERAREPVRAIDVAARAALADLRRVLGVLQESAQYEPQPGLGQLDHLIEQVRMTGLDVALEIQGTTPSLPAAVDLSAYRIVQEALTNTLKHAGAEHVRVRIRYGERLELEVRDDGHGLRNGAGRQGRGLVGMRERVTLLGGILATGPAPGGGYRVAAEIPIESAA
jgi:signal transduction histidine kinase